MPHRGTAAILALLSLGLAGCAGDSGGAAAAGAAPLAVVRAAQSSVVSAAGKAARRLAPSSVASAAGKASQAKAKRSASRRPAVPAASQTGDADPPTPASPSRQRSAQPPRAAAVADAARLAAPACEQYAAGLAGSIPPAVLARGAGRALATLTESMAAALIGMPVVAPEASLPARERLDGALARISRALSAGDDAKATAIAQATARRIRAYARALGIAGCG